MREVIDFWIVPGLSFLAEWSARWALVLLVLALWFAVRPPQRAATRHLLCVVALAAGLLLPVIPRWQVAIATRPAASPAIVDKPRSGEYVAPGPEAGLSLPPSNVVARPPEPRLGVVERRSQPAPEPIGVWRLVAIGLAAIWVLAVLVLSAGLVGGRRLLAKLKLQAVPCDPASGRLLVECQRALGLSRPTRLAMHRSITSPVVIGGRMPIILVPPDWDGWPEAHRRDCLRHELTHLKRHDDWAKLIQELVLVPFFFHPLVRWLLKRLDRERELLCDEAVVALGGDPVVYARLLLDLARRPGRRLILTATLRPGWLPFFDRGTVAVRIERLLEDDMMRSLAPPSPRRLFAIGTVALAAALGISSLHVRAVEASAKQDNPPDRLMARAEPAKNERPRTIEGRILELKGKPAAGAVVVAGFTGDTATGRTNHQVFKTDQDGRFVWPIPDGSVTIALIAHKEGRGPAIWDEWLPPEKQDGRVELMLPEAEPFQGVVVDGEGRPLTAARVRIEMLVQGHSTPGEGGVTHHETRCTRIPLELIDGSPLGSLFQTSTDRTGAFTIPAALPKAWLNRERGEVGLKLGLSVVGGREMRVRAEKKSHDYYIIESLAEHGLIAAPAGDPVRLTAFPAARVAGRVTTNLPGVRVAGLLVRFQDSNPEIVKPLQALRKPHTRTNACLQKVLTDEDGRFVLDGLNEGTINIFVDGDGDGDSWTYRAGKDVPLKLGKTTDVTLELIRGVEVEGKVVAKGTGRPIGEALVGGYGPHRPFSGSMNRYAKSSTKSDAQGRYHFRLPPGEAYFYLMETPPNYRNADKPDSTRTVTIPEGVAHFDVTPIVLTAIVAEQGRIFDAQGSPVAGVKILGLGEGIERTPWPEPETVTDASGAFPIPNGWYNMIPIGQPVKLQIRLRDGSEQEADAIPTVDGSYLVKLVAAGTHPK